MSSFLLNNYVGGNMRKRIIVFIISIISVTAMLLFSYWFYTEKLEIVDVYIASHNLSQRTKISYEDLQCIKMPRMYLNEDIKMNSEDIIGKYVKLSYSIPKGSYIYSSSIESNIGDLANTLLQKDEVTYDIYTSEVKINPGSLNKNMCLDLYLTIVDKDNLISDLLLSNARIIGFYDQNGKEILDYDKQTRVNIVSIAVNKDDVSILNKALVVGEIRAVVGEKTYKTNLKATQNNTSEIYNWLN